ncbi:MAG: YaiO family outer rane beta-barrel protein [Pseudomonadota bacterium]|jgi:YaiO family outer membrane protein
MKLQFMFRALPLVVTLATNPAFAQDYDTLIAQAVVERNAGNLHVAEDILRRAYELPPNKAEVSYLLGMVLAYQGLYTDALTLIDTALLSAPNDADLQLARVRILELRAVPLIGSPDADQFVTTGFSRNTIDQAEFAEWNDRNVEYRVIRKDGGQNYIRGEHNHRFSLHDTMIEGGMTLGAGSRLPLQVALGVTPEADFMPEYFARIETSKTLAESRDTYGTVAAYGSYQHSSFANGRTDRLMMGLEYYLPGVDAWLTPALGMVRDQDDESTVAWMLGAHWQVNGRARVGLYLSDGPATENLITVDTRAWAAYWQLDLSARWRLFLAYSSSERIDSYTRDAADMTLRYSF